MAKEDILVVDDEQDIQELIEYNLAKEGYRVRCVGSGEECLRSEAQQKPDLIVLDLMLPQMDGFDVCRELRSNRSRPYTPIIILSAKGEETDIVTGLELGADDYVIKPFAPRVLLARIKNVLRRIKREPVSTGEAVAYKEIEIIPSRHEVLLDGAATEMTSTEFKLLHFLARQPGSVFTRAQIVDAVHGEDYPVTDRSVDVQVVGLRRKLGRCGDYLETVRGVGYRFRDLE
ncbi:MAG: response regulator transcription factor [Oligoflexia bacterium]|nr:response regulator transcription factor [Oligoflexia bacterium]